MELFSFLVPILACSCFLGVPVFTQETADNAIGNLTTTRLEWEECQYTATDPGVVNNVYFKPHPFLIPTKEKISLQYDITFHEDLKEPLDMKMDILKKIPLLFGMVSWLRVPCIETNVITFGSCYFRDLCNDKNFNFKYCIKPDTREEYECGCPTFKKGRYLIKPFEYDVPEIPPGIPQFILDGEMALDIQFLSGGRNISCAKSMIYTKTTMAP